MLTLSEAFPKSEHLRICVQFCVLLGIIPKDFMFDGSKLLRKMYGIYASFTLAYYIFFVVTAYVELVFILRADKVRLDAVSANLCITLIYTITIIRQFVFQRSDEFKAIIDQMIAEEREIFATEEPEVVKIYKGCVTENVRRTKYYLFVIYLVTSQYILRPLVVDPIQVEIGNATVLVKPLPLSSWFPFDAQEKYLQAYAWHIFDALVGASYVGFTDIFMFNLIAYPVAQLRIMQYLLRNIESRTRRYKLLNDIKDHDLAAFLTVVDVIRRHRNIQMYVDKFNNTMGALMLVDFLQSSLQIGSIITQMVGVELTYVVVVFVSTFFLNMLLRLILYYYYANEIIVMSQNLSHSIWESNWLDQSRQVKRMMYFFLMKVRKPMRCHLGAFGEMSLSAFISILRAAYSYIMLIYTVGGRKN